MNQSAMFLPRRGNGFPLSPGERAGVGVKRIIPSAFTCIVVRYYLLLIERLGCGG